MKSLKKKIMGVVLAATMLFTGATALADDSHTWDNVAAGVSVTLSRSHQTETISFTAPVTGSYTFGMSNVTKTSGSGNGQFRARFRVNNSNWSTNNYSTSLTKGSTVTVEVARTNNTNCWGSLKISGSYVEYPEFTGNQNITIPANTHAATMLIYKPSVDGILTLTTDNVVSQRGLTPSVTFNGTNINRGPFEVKAGEEYLISAGGNHSGSYDLIGTLVIPAQSVTASDLELTVGTDAALEVVVTPAGTTDTDLAFVSDTPDVASVDANGVVTANALGTAIITVTIGSVSCTCTVSVVEEIIPDPVDPTDPTDPVLPDVPFYTEDQLRAMSVQNFVEGLYPSVLGRQFDAEGRDSWMNSILEQNGTATSVAIGFLESPEFTSKNLSNEDFVATCYRVFCNRAASEAETAQWVAQLEAGSTRDTVIRQFAQSPEWASICAFFMVNV